VYISKHNKSKKHTAIRLSHETSSNNILNKFN
jgi:hypothetical protein